MNTTNNLMAEALAHPDVAKAFVSMAPDGKVKPDHLFRLRATVILSLLDVGQRTSALWVQSLTVKQFAEECGLEIQGIEER